MGKSLARNLARNGFKIALFNRHLAGVEEGVATNFKNHFPELKEAEAFDEIAAFANALETPRKIMKGYQTGLLVNFGLWGAFIFAIVISYNGILGILEL